MTANTGTVTVKPRWSPGATFTAAAYGTFSGTVASGDTLTISDLVPTNGFTVSEVKVWGGPLDTDASPTATLVVGDGTDTDFYVASKVPAGITDTGQMIIFGDGVGVRASAGTYPASGNVVLTVGGTMGTGGSSPVVNITVTYVCDDAEQ